MYDSRLIWREPVSTHAISVDATLVASVNSVIISQLSPSVCLGWAYIVIIRCAGLSLWLDSPMFWAP